MKALAIAATNLRRLLRWRANIFFLLVLPMLIILLLGVAFGSETARLGVVSRGSGPLGEDLVAALERRPELDVVRYGSVPALEDAVGRGRLQAGLVVPQGTEVAVRGGRTAVLRYWARPDSLAQEVRLAVEAAVAEQGAVLRAARFLGSERGVPLDEALEAARAAADTVPAVEVRVRTAAGEPYPEPGGRFDAGASTQLLLFVFLTSLNGSIWLIETRRLGVSRRMLATPTSLRTILLGETLGRFAVALVQALIIAVGAFVLFGVDWGDPVAAVAIVLAFGLVGTGAGTLLGSVASSQEQAGPVALLLGLVLAALGGSMVPLEVFSPTMRDVAHATPHAWANDAFAELLRHDGRLLDVLPQLGVLLAFAIGLLAAATWRLRRALVA